MISGGAGFVGSAVARRATSLGHTVFNIDRKNEASVAPQLKQAQLSGRYSQVIANVSDATMLAALMREYKPDAVIHCAGGASLEKGELSTGGLAATLGVLEAVSMYLGSAGAEIKDKFRLVLPFRASALGGLEADEDAFDETMMLSPTCREGALEAAGLTMAQGWQDEFDLPTVYAGASILYGPWQNKDALIPALTRTALSGAPIAPAFPNETQDWLHVDDFASGLIAAAELGDVRENFLFSASGVRRNFEIAQMVCKILDGKRPRADGGSYADQVRFNKDETQALKCALSPAAAENRLGWAPEHQLLMGLATTVGWLLDNMPPQPRANAPVAAE